MKRITQIIYNHESKTWTPTWGEGNNEEGINLKEAEEGQLLAYNEFIKRDVGRSET